MATGTQINVDNGAVTLEVHSRSIELPNGVLVISKPHTGVPSIGERRVGAGFNPSGVRKVGDAKLLAAAFIDFVNAFPTRNQETARWKAMAMTEIETGAMYVVKALTAGE